MTDTPKAGPDTAAEQRMADAATHRANVGRRLADLHQADWVEIARDLPSSVRARATLDAMEAEASFIWGAQLPGDPDHGRRGGIDLLVRADGRYLPVLVVRHKVSDPGSGVRTSPLETPTFAAARPDPRRKARPQARDQLRLAHIHRLLQAVEARLVGDRAEQDRPRSGRRRSVGSAAPGGRNRAVGGVIGMDADVVVWHDLEAPNWPGGRTALDEYDRRFADRLAVAAAAAAGDEPLARPSRILECRSCPWWPVCEQALRADRDVSLVVRGEDATAFRSIGVRTVDGLAALDPQGRPPVPLMGAGFGDSVVLARAWLRGLSMIRRVRDVRVPRADVEVDVDMESFGDGGAYLWGALLSGSDVGEPAGYRAFATWEPVPTSDEARSFSEFWAWLRTIRMRAAARGLTFRAYCYNELAENRWLLSSASRFEGVAGVPAVAEVRAFIQSEEWVDLFAIVREQFLCAQGRGLKTIAPEAGFSWRDPEAGGENSMRWYRDAVGLDGLPPDARQRDRLLRYNEDDVQATLTLRRWMTSTAMTQVPYAGDL
ncbi:RecB family nuclease, putative, TM0106 family [Actinoalloteichus sp. GBA129-24]|uniref:RecB family nuclease, putative, TM0106 family n=2 Tax=Pseudonocardiaceae TaxID=2070 RepID=A0AAC9PPL1_9PSEU|nr:RecB family nuclease, putative, TM0106 family [Actinoalloteichus fjordicus]APU18107.1 RecB family nuclease, putative, TM0106 family [Actinoalloteichus sp. GBA129-24]